MRVWRGIGFDSYRMSGACPTGGQEGTGWILACTGRASMQALWRPSSPEAQWALGCALGSQGPPPQSWPRTAPP